MKAIKLSKIVLCTRCEAEFVDLVPEDIKTELVPRNRFAKLLDKFLGKPVKEFDTLHYVSCPYCASKIALYTD